MNASRHLSICCIRLFRSKLQIFDFQPLFFTVSWPSLYCLALAAISLAFLVSLSGWNVSSTASHDSGQNKQVLTRAEQCANQCWTNSGWDAEAGIVLHCLWCLRNSDVYLITRNA